VVLLERVEHRLVGVALRVDDEVRELLVGVAEAERLEQHGDGLLALAVDADVDDVLLVDLELEPRAAAGDHLGVDDVLLRRRLVGVDAEVDAGRSHELRHDDALGAVDDERAAVVIMGKSPMKTVCSLISPVCAFMNRAVTNSGRA
jgi:hypothetical protein